MYNPYKKQSDILEKFRIKAHLRSYVKEPIKIDEALYQRAADELKKLPYDKTDPTDIVARRLVINAYNLGLYDYTDLTAIGCNLTIHEKYRGKQIVNKRVRHSSMMKNRFQLKAI